MFLSVRAAVSWRRRQNSLGAGGVFYVPCQSSLLRGKEEDLLQQAMTRDFKSGASRWWGKDKLRMHFIEGGLS